MRVRANNACGVGTYRSLAVTFNCREEKVLSNVLNLSCYPLPATNQLTVSFSSNQETTNSIRIIDVIGKTVFNQKGNSIIGQNKCIIDLSAMPGGIYLVEVINGGKRALERVVIE